MKKAPIVLLFTVTSVGSPSTGHVWSTVSLQVCGPISVTAKDIKAVERTEPSRKTLLDFNAISEDFGLAPYKLPVFSKA
jgi:hypothetical protein